MQRPRCSMNWPKMRGSTVPSRRRRSMAMRVVMAPESRSGLRACQFDSVRRGAVQSRPEDTPMSGHDNGVEGGDLALIHTVEVPHFASDGVLEVIDDATATGKGFRGEDYLPAMWQGGTFQGKRYSLPLDVPQHILYMNVKVMKDAGLTGSDGRPRVPAGRDELVTMAKRIAAKADTFGFAIGTVNPGRYTWGFHNLLWQNGADVYTVDLKRAGVSDPAALEVAEFWAALEGQHKIAPPANANCRDAFIAGKLGLWIAGSWNL